MSKKTKSKKQPTKKTQSEKISPQDDDSPKPGGFHAFRETLESVVIAFVLAFLFRTFEAEAFQIPTGSMSPALLGRHKDVNCSECGYRFRITDSDEERDDVQRVRAAFSNPEVQQVEFQGQWINRAGMRQVLLGVQVVGGKCPICRHVMPVRPDLDPQLSNQVDLEGIEFSPSYNGDRILVNKYGFTFNDPERWDVVVFKYPGNAGMNYIKRLVGLPGESLQVYQGDLFSRPLDGSEEYAILRKPPVKVEAMLQPVHDSDYEAAKAYEAGWPLRWAATTRDGWNVKAEVQGATVAQEFSVDVAGEESEVAWLRYRHLVPDAHHWQVIRDYSKNKTFEKYDSREDWQARIGPSLINDFNPYNAKLSRASIDRARVVGLSSPDRFDWEAPEENEGVHWVGDLAVRCHLLVEEATGELTLDLVEAGKHFRAVINLENGEAKLQIVDGPTGKPLEFAASGQTSLSAAGDYTLLFANVDDQLLLWVDGGLVEFDQQEYSPETLFVPRRQQIPWASEDDAKDQGDLSPVGIGAKGTRLRVSRLEVLRDIYYLASNPNNTGEDYPPIHEEVTIEGEDYPEVNSYRDLFSDPTHWGRFVERRAVSFPVEEDQFFVMGDNSQFSQDARLWVRSNDLDSVPGGAYLDRRLLIGKAVCVFWPHSWGSIPGLRKLPGFPNFSDMRLVR